jgi:hypothetical protein
VKPRLTTGCSSTPNRDANKFQNANLTGDGTTFLEGAISLETAKFVTAMSTKKAFEIREEFRDWTSMEIALRIRSVQRAYTQNMQINASSRGKYAAIQEKIDEYENSIS